MAKGGESNTIGIYPVGQVITERILKGSDAGGSDIIIPVHPNVVDHIGGTHEQLADVTAGDPASEPKEIGIDRIPKSPSSLWLADNRPTWKQIKPE